MGNKKSAPVPLDSFHFEVGVTKTREGDFFFQHFFSNPTAYANYSDKLIQHGGDPKIYRIFPNTLDNNKTPPDIANIITDLAWDNEVMQPLRACVTEARAKKDKLRELVRQNPNLSYVVFLLDKAQRPFYLWDAHAPQSCGHRLLLYMALPLFLAYMFPVFTVALLLGMLLDFLTCNSCNRGNANEVDFLTAICQKNPECDTAAIDQMLANRMGELINVLNAKYPELAFSWRVQTKLVVHKSKEHNWTETIDQFLIVINYRIDKLSNQPQQQLRDAQDSYLHPL
jgi:hypothetical protein